MRRTFRRLGALPGLGRFLIAHFLYTDAINTVVLFMAVYAVMEKLVAPDDLAFVVDLFRSRLPGRFRRHEQPEAA